MSEIKVKLGSEKKCLQVVNVEMPVSRVKEKIQKAFVHVQARAKMPGFRPGKTPIEVIKENYQDTAYNQVQDQLLREGVAEAIKSKNIQVVQTPVVRSVQFNPEKPFQFEFHVEVAPTFKLSNYKGYKINKKVKPIGEEDVKKSLNEIANSNSKLILSKDQTLSTSHFAVISYEGFLDGKPIEGAKADNFLLNMSAPQAIAGLAEGMLGQTVNEERQVKVKFPDDSPSKDLAGKEAQFQVKLITIKEKKVPALDDELAKDVNLGSLEELKKKIHENLTLEWEKGSKRDVENQVLEKLLNDNKFEVPQSLVENQKNYLFDRQKERLTQQGVPPEEQHKILDGLKADASLKAEREVRIAYILNAIADREKIDVSSDEIMSRIEKKVEAANPSEKESLRKTMLETYRDRIQSEIREEKIFNAVLGNAKIKEMPGGK